MNNKALASMQQLEMMQNQGQASIVRPSAGSDISTYGPAQRELMEKTNFLQRLFPSAEYKAELGSAKELDTYNAVVGRQAEQTQQQFQREAPGAMGLAQRELIASDIDPAEGARIGRAMYGAENAEELNAAGAMGAMSMNDPRFSEQAQMQQQQGLMMQQQQQVKAQGEAQTLENQLLRENAAVMKPLMAGRRSLSAARDLRTLTTEGGDVRFPGKSRGAYKALRFQGINAIRETTEAGALQAAEIEFFESIVPAYDDWIKLSDAERIAQNKELEYFFETKLRDDLQSSGQGIDFAEFMGEGRTIDDILTPGMPDDFTRVEGFTDPTAEVERVLSLPGALGSPQGTLPQIDLSGMTTGFGAR